jgi:hypothetical protein
MKRLYILSFLLLIGVSISGCDKDECPVCYECECICVNEECSVCHECGCICKSSSVWQPPESF